MEALFSDMSTQGDCRDVACCVIFKRFVDHILYHTYLKRLYTAMESALSKLAESCQDSPFSIKERNLLISQSVK